MHAQLNKLLIFFIFAKFRNKPFLKWDYIQTQWLVAGVRNIVEIVGFKSLGQRSDKLPILHLLPQHSEPTQGNPLPAKAGLDNMVVIIES